MDTSGLIQTYDRRAVSSAAVSHAIMAPQYVPAHTYSQAPSTNLVAPHQQQLQQHNPFGYGGGYTGAPMNTIIPAYAAQNYVQQRQIPPPMQAEHDGRGVSYIRTTTRQGYAEEHHSQSPPIKSEPMWAPPPNAPHFIPANTKTTGTTTPIGASAEVNFGTEVDTLMKAIQAKSQTSSSTPQTPIEQSQPVVGASQTPPYRQAAPQAQAFPSTEMRNSQLTQGDSQEEVGSPRAGKKRYQCTIEGCTKSFYQKTHLDIHERAHTGVKPYPCKEPGCGRSFSQLGNLKTHERRHTGERPYQCEICGKRFAQRGNVRAHKIVHDQSKPYLCRLDDCGKQFTQLGNLKSHQNKFHIATIRALTAKFASIKDGDIVHAGDKELWEYFANLYKNSNKGIKGRGKDRKVGPNSMAHNNPMRSLNVVTSRGGGYGMAGPGRGNMVVGVNVPRGEGGQYEMFDVDDGSQSAGSSASTCYEDAPDGFEDSTHGRDLAFGDRIY